MKELATWRDPGYFITAFAGDKEVEAFIKDQLPVLECRYQLLKGNALLSSCPVTSPNVGKRVESTPCSLYNFIFETGQKA